MARQSARKEAQDKVNLKPGSQVHKLTAEEQQRGGKNSVKARREKKAFREWMEYYLSKPANVGGEEVDRKALAAARAVEIVTGKTIGEDITASEFIRAMELIRDTIGEKPLSQVEIATADQIGAQEVLDMWRENRK